MGAFGADGEEPHSDRRPAVVSGSMQRVEAGVLPRPEGLAHRSIVDFYGSSNLVDVTPAGENAKARIASQGVASIETVAK